ncbi:MAG: transcriptional regulator [Anaerolineales bacterium]|nr:transcriptional regulator [Anaerolineales bacterium]
MGTRVVPLEKIVGSVGRYHDFTRTFLPRSAVNAERWARVDAILNSMEGYPPIELYKIGDVYFVRDGNHRISVARANGLSEIEAYVTEIDTDVDLTQDDFERDQWIIKIERSEFEAQTHLDELRPDNNVVLTEPGRYKILLRHVEVHRYFRNLDLERAGGDWRLSWEEAVCSWYDNVYLPVVEEIRQRDLLEDFPSRTEADLYLWIVYHREELAKRYDLAPLDAETAVRTFAEKHSDKPLQQAVKSINQGLHNAFAEKPLGMTSEAFEDARSRHDAGERTIGEAESERNDGEKPWDDLPEGMVYDLTPAEFVEFYEPVALGEPEDTQSI